MPEGPIISQVWGRPLRRQIPAGLLKARAKANGEELSRMTKENAIVAVYNNQVEAEEAVQQLQRAGFD